MQCRPIRYIVQACVVWCAALVPASVASRLRFWNFQTYAEASWMLKKSLKCRDVSERPVEFVVLFGGLQLIFTIFIFLQLKSAKDAT